LRIDNQYPRHRSRGAALALTLVMLSVFFGMAALVVDVGRLYNTRASLQNAADAASLAASQDLGKSNYVQAMSVADASVRSMLDVNPIWGGKTTTSYDLVFGRTQTSMNGQGLSFIPGVTPPNALEVTAHYDLPYTFGQIIGFHGSLVNASSTSAIRARDIMFVFDISCSMGALTSTSELEADLTALGIPFVGSGLANYSGVTICHYPTNPANALTITIASPAVAAHLAHGDTLGECADGFVDCDGIGDDDGGNGGHDDGKGGGEGGHGDGKGGGKGGHGGGKGGGKDGHGGGKGGHGSGDD